MFILVVALAELYFFAFFCHIYLSIAIALLYLLSYLDHSEYDGSRHWPAFRKLVRKLSSIQQVEVPASGTLVLFSPCRAPSSLFFGAPAGSLFIVPPIYMWVPFLRDACLWCGAITGGNLVIMDILNKNITLCFAPSCFLDSVTQGGDLVSSLPDDNLLQLLIEKEVKISVANVHYESDRYYFWNFAIQRWFHAKIQYAFPVIYFSLWSHAHVEIHFNAPIDCKLRKTVAKLKFDLLQGALSLGTNVIGAQHVTYSELL